MFRFSQNPKKNSANRSAIASFCCFVNFGVGIFFKKIKKAQIWAILVRIVFRFGLLEAKPLQLVSYKDIKLLFSKIIPVLRISIPLVCELALCIPDTSSSPRRKR